MDNSEVAVGSALVYYDSFPLPGAAFGSGRIELPIVLCTSSVHK